MTTKYERESVTVEGDVRFFLAHSDLAYIEGRWWPDRIDYMVITQGALPEDGQHKITMFATFAEALSFLIEMQWLIDQETENYKAIHEPAPDEYGKEGTEDLIEGELHTAK